MARLVDVGTSAGTEGVVPAPVTAASPAPVGKTAESLHEKLLTAYQAIESSLGGSASRVITFVGSGTGDGAATLAGEFAMLVSQQVGRRTVLFDTTGGLPEQAGLRARTAGDCADFVAGRCGMEDIVRPVQGESLYWGCLTSPGRSMAVLLSDPGFPDAVLQMRQMFDYVVFHVPGDRSSSAAMALVTESDGAILVVEAEKTRWQVARNVSENIVAHGGKVLGAILNRRRHHIPQVIYDRL